MPSIGVLGLGTCALVLSTHALVVNVCPPAGDVMSSPNYTGHTDGCASMTAPTTWLWDFLIPHTALYQYIVALSRCRMVLLTSAFCLISMTTDLLCSLLTYLDTDLPFTRCSCIFKAFIMLWLMLLFRFSVK